MTKKALVSTIEPRGKDNLGYRVLEVVEIGNEFEVHPNLQWIDCPDYVELDKYWFNPNTSEFKKLPEAINPVELLGELAVNDEGKITEKYVWDWDKDTWTKVARKNPI
jgi:hypothetical protein